MKLKIEGTKYLEGTIEISGSKNATLPLMVCSLLSEEAIVLDNIPNISDVKIMSDLLKEAGVEVLYFLDKKKMILKRKEIKTELKKESIHKIRASYYLMGAFVANRLNFNMNYPGGCSFSKRPIDYHIDAFKKAGYKIIEKDDDIYFIAKKKYNKNLIINLEQKSVGTTINILLFSVLKKGKTVIKNASLEPEVMQVIFLLRKMGAYIISNDASQIEIIGVKKLNGATIRVIPDRIEAGSFMLLAAAVDKSDVYIKNIYVSHLTEVIKTIRKLGVNVETSKGVIHIKKEKKLNFINKIISTYPAFPTDLQQILSVTCLKGDAPSIIIDTVYPKRISHIEEIKKAGGLARVVDDKIYVTPSKTNGSDFDSHDLRCGFSCIVLASISNGVSTIDNIEIVLRGYENIVSKLKSLNLDIEII